MLKWVADEVWDPEESRIPLLLEDLCVMELMKTQDTKKVALVRKLTESITDVFNKKDLFLALQHRRKGHFYTL